MKNLLDPDLVGGGASGESVISSGEWILGLDEWKVLERRRKSRGRTGRVLKRLGTIRELLEVAAWRGAGLGLALTLVEALFRAPLVFKFKISIPVELFAVSTTFNLLLGMVVAVVAAPLLRLRRGGLWHALFGVAILSLLLVGVDGPHPTVQPGPAMAGGLAVVYLAGLGLVRWRRLGARGVAASGVLVTAVTMVGPQQMVSVSEHGPRVAAPAAPEGAPNVLLVVLDTLRADRLDLMGYERATFPWLTDFSVEGAVFERAQSAAPWTVPSHASMFTGLYPSGHGAHHEHMQLDEGYTTLADVLSSHGWETVALSANPWISRSSGLTQGFRVEKPAWVEMLGASLTLAYRFGWRLGLVSQDLSGAEVTRSWLRWLEAWDGERPFLAFLNYAEPHIPYHMLPKGHLNTFSAPEASRDELYRASVAVMDAEARGEEADAASQDHVNDLYDAAIYYQGGLVARAVEALRQRGILDDTVVVLVSDHGDLLGEHGGLFEHTRSLVDDLLAVPLVVRYPARVPGGQRIEEPVTTAALMPTILDLAGLSPPAGLQTRSFAPLFEGDVEASRSPLLAENYEDSGKLMKVRHPVPRSEFDRLNVRYRSLEEDGWKLIVDSTGHRWLFRPVDDPAETHNLADEHPEVVERLRANLETLVAAYGFSELDAEHVSAGSATPEIDPAVQDSLRSLGYLGGG